MSEDRTIKYGDLQVPVLQRCWKTTSERLPYRKTYMLTPGEHWHNAPITHKQWEYYVLLQDRQADPPGVISYEEDRQFGVKCIPAGAAIARELMAEGAICAVFTECWGRGVVIVGPDLICVKKEGELGHILDRLRTANDGYWRGLPDVVACFPRRGVVMREAKHISAKYKDRLGPNQHAFSRAAQRLFGDKLDLAVVEWGC